MRIADRPAAELAAAENSAREKKLGIWSLAEPVAPWEFRKPAAQCSAVARLVKPKEFAVNVDVAAGGGRLV